MPATPPWDEVRVFLAVARAGGLVAAAAALRVSEATVSRHLRALEARLGARLFDRLPNRLVATPLAGQLVAAAAAMEEGAASFARLAQAAGEAPGEPVRLTATASISLFVTRHLGRVLAAAPGVRLQLVTTRAPLSLGHREAELALRMRRPPATGHLVVRQVGRIAFALYAAHGLLAGRRVTGPADLAGLTFVGLRDDPSSRQSSWLEALAGGGPMPVRLDDLHLRREAALVGAGATLLPCFLGDAEPGLRRLLPPPEALAEDVFLLAHRDLRDLPSIRAVGRALAGLFRDEARALLGAAGAPRPGP